MTRAAETTTDTADASASAQEAVLTFNEGRVVKVEVAGQVLYAADLSPQPYWEVCWAAGWSGSYASEDEAKEDCLHLCGHYRSVREVRPDSPQYKNPRPPELRQERTALALAPKRLTEDEWAELQRLRNSGTPEAVLQAAKDGAVLGNIDSPLNACMHRDHCNAWKAEANRSTQFDALMAKQRVELISENNELRAQVEAQAGKGSQAPDASAPRAGGPNLRRLASRLMHQLSDRRPRRALDLGSLRYVLNAVLADKEAEECLNNLVRAAWEWGVSCEVDCVRWGEAGDSYNQGQRDATAEAATVVHGLLLGTRAVAPSAEPNAKEQING